MEKALAGQHFPKDIESMQALKGLLNFKTDLFYGRITTLLLRFTKIISLFEDHVKKSTQFYCVVYFLGDSLLYTHTSRTRWNLHRTISFPHDHSNQAWKIFRSVSFLKKSQN